MTAETWRDRALNAEAVIEKMQAYITNRDAEKATLCCVCREPVWPSLVLYQQWEEDEERVVWGHKRCLDATYSDTEPTSINPSPSDETGSGRG